MIYRRYLILLLFCLLVMGIGWPSLWAGDRHPVIVIEVVDGDTLRIIYKGEEEMVKLDGIGTPHSRVNPEAEADFGPCCGEDPDAMIQQGKLAIRFVMSLVKPGDKVSVEFDVQKRDKYGRLLGYVYLSDGRMLNEEIIKAGYAGLMTIPPNVKYEQRFLKADREAREKKRGLWK